MSDWFNLPGAEGADIQAYNGAARAGASQLPFLGWTKPRGKSWLQIICIGAGGGGGGGRGSTAGSARGGGGGGGSSGITRVIVPMLWVPERLFVIAVKGGGGGAGGSSANGSSGTVGELSRVNVHPELGSVNSCLASSGNAAPVAAGGGTAAGGGAGGTGGTIATIANNPLANIGFSQYIAGVTGSTGGAATGAVGVALAVGTACMILGGTGGGGCTTTEFAGGQYNAVSNTPFYDRLGGLAGAGEGRPGGQFAPFPLFYGGTGGGSSNSTTGGAGGNASSAPGTGGGGGGAGVTVGGNGGAGGPGLVLMMSW